MPTSRYAATAAARTAAVTSASRPYRPGTAARLPASTTAGTIRARTCRLVTTAQPAKNARPPSRGRADQRGRGPEDAPDEHRHAFLAFIAGLIGDAGRYLARGDVDPLRSGASYNLAGRWLDDVELLESARELSAVVQSRLANAPKAGRTRRIFATVLLPGGDPVPPRP